MDYQESFCNRFFKAQGQKKTDFTELLRRFDRGEFDLVAVGRALLQDPDWIRKVKDGKSDELKDFSKDSLSLLY